MSQVEIDNMSLDQWGESYSQLLYAVEFDSKRTGGDGKEKLFYPIPI